MIGAVKGYKVVIVMSKSVSEERQKIIKSFGARIILTSEKEGSDGAIRKVRNLVKENPEKYFYPNQYQNPNNPNSHKQTAKEIWNQTNGKVTHLIAGLGTSGTIMGLSKYLKMYNPNIQTISAEPFPNHKLQGLKNLETSIIPPIFDIKLLDKRIKVRDSDAFTMMKNLPKKEGLFVGMSSGAAMWVSREIAISLRKGLIVTIFPDRGEKYLSTIK